MDTIAVTGATGFVGRALCGHLAERGHSVIALARNPPAASSSEAVAWRSFDLGRTEGIRPEAFAGAKAAVHLAGLAHSGRPASPEAAARLYAVNTAGARAAAVAAREAGVRRFVFVSSATVHGSTTGPEPVREDCPLVPDSAYAHAKAEAEAAVYAAAGWMEVCMVRPPLVYGAGVKGNLARLLDWAARGYPLPSAAWDNRRSLIGLSNLCAFLELAAGHRAAAGQTFLVSDGPPIATAALYDRICRAMGRPARSLPLPRPILAGALRLAGRKRDLGRLLGDFVLDTGKAEQRLGWQPPVAPDDEIAAMVAAYRQHP